MPWNLAGVSDLAVLQVRRFDGLLADTVEKVEEATTLIRKVILRPLGPPVDIAAFGKGTRRGPARGANIPAVAFGLADLVCSNTSAAPSHLDQGLAGLTRQDECR